MYAHLGRIEHQDPPIFEVIFKDNTRSAVDEYIQAILIFSDGLRESNRLDRPIYMLIDVTQSGIYSLSYSRQKIGELVQKIGDIPKAYFAYLVDDTQDRFVIESFQYTGNPRQKDTRRVFTGAERDQAIAWLLTNTEV